MTTNEYNDDLRIKRQSVFDAVVGSIKSLKGGNILIEVENRPTIDIRASKSNEVNKIVKDLAVKLSENNITIVLLRKGKEAIIMGKDASPSISKIISGSDDLQIKSVTESSKLISEIGTTLSSDDEGLENKKEETTS